jgi:hypothetical protein
MKYNVVPCLDFVKPRLCRNAKIVEEGQLKPYERCDFFISKTKEELSTRAH